MFGNFHNDYNGKRGNTMSYGVVIMFLFIKVIELDQNLIISKIFMGRVMRNTLFDILLRNTYIHTK